MQIEKTILDNGKTEYKTEITMTTGNTSTFTAETKDEIVKKILQFASFLSPEQLETILNYYKNDINTEDIIEEKNKSKKYKKENDKKTKSRGNGEGTVYWDKTKKKWIGLLTVGTKPDGKLDRRPFSGDTKKEAQEKMDEAKDKLRKGVFIFNNNTSFEKIFFKCIDLKLQNEDIGLTTYEEYETLARIHINPEIGHMKPKDINKDIIQDFIYKKAKEKTKQGKTMSKSTLRHFRTIIHFTLEYAIDEHLLYFNPCRKIKIPKNAPVKPSREISINEQEILTNILLDRIFETFKENKAGYSDNNLALLLKFYQGPRIGEVTALQLSSINLKREMIIIDRKVSRVKNYDYNKDDPTSSKTILIFGKPKTDESIREVPIPKVLIPLLEHHKLLKKQKRLEAQKFGFTYDPKNLNLFFSTCTGNVIERQNIQRTLNAIINTYNKTITNEDDKIKHINLHALHHAFATRLLEKNRHIKTVATLLGQSVEAVTYGYSHVSTLVKQDAISDVNEVLSPLIKSKEYAIV